MSTKSSEPRLSWRSILLHSKAYVLSKTSRKLLTLATEDSLSWTDQDNLLVPLAQTFWLSWSKISAGIARLHPNRACLTTMKDQQVRWTEKIVDHKVKLRQMRMLSVCSLRTEELKAHCKLIVATAVQSFHKTEMNKTSRASRTSKQVSEDSKSSKWRGKWAQKVWTKRWRSTISTINTVSEQPPR